VTGLRDTVLAAFAIVAALTAAAGESLSAQAEPGARHVIYLHGRIIQQQQNPRPHSPEFGYYELEKILAAFRSRGFVVTGEIRPKAASVSDSANHVVEQVLAILKKGVPADHVSVVGGSMGASITMLASVRLQNPDMRFVMLGACPVEGARDLRKEEGKGPVGHILSVREASDDMTNTCALWKEDPQQPQPRVREIVLRTGLKHGFFYRPLPEWLDPVVEWITAR
jgi:pimeloyl-ACP methyl ester carboxylesterase